MTLAWCEKDRLISRPRVMRVRADEVVLRDCGHVPMYDDPDLVAEVIRSGVAAGAGAPTSARPS